MPMGSQHFLHVGTMQIERLACRFTRTDAALGWQSLFPDVLVPLQSPARADTLASEGSRLKVGISRALCVCTAQANGSAHEGFQMYE